MSSVKEWVWEDTTFFKWKLKNLGWFKYLYCASKSIDKYDNWQNKATWKCKECEWPWIYVQTTTRKHILNVVHYHEHHGLKNLHKNLTHLFLPQDLWNLYMPQDLKRIHLWMNLKGEKTKADISKGYKPKRITGAFKDWVQTLNTKVKVIKTYQSIPWRN